MLLEPMLARLDQAAGLEDTLDAGLRDLISLHGAEMGNVQLLGVDGALVIVAARGLGRAFLKVFERIDAQCASVCGRVLRSGRPLVIPDVERDEDFARFRAFAATVPFRSVMTFPLTCASGEVIGAVSAHSANVFAPTPLEFETAQRYSRHFADTVVSRLPSAVLRAAAAERLSQALLAGA